MHSFDSRLIIERMKQVLELKEDKELREFFGVAQSTFSSWKNRNAIPFETVINFSLEHNLDLNWLILGNSNSEQLATDEQMMLLAYRQLDPTQKMNLMMKMSGLSNGTSGGVVQSGDGNNHQVFHGDVNEVTGISK